MYEKFRMELMLKLSTQGFGIDDIERMLRCVDSVSKDYRIEKTCTELAVYGEVLPEIVKTFFVARKIEGFSEGTLKNYKYFLENFFCWIRKDPREVTANDIRLYLYTYQEQKKISNNSLDRLRICLHAFFDWCVNEEYITKNPVNGTQKIKVEKKQKEALNNIEFEYIRKACKDTRERAIVDFMYSTGCRAGELVILKKDDIDWNTKDVHLFGKGKKHRTSYLNARAELSLLGYLSERKDNSEYVFVSQRKPYDKLSVAAVERLFRDIVKRAGESIQITKHVTPHTIRHTTATTALHNGMAIQEIKELLGHSNINTTMVYAEVENANVKMSHNKYVV